MASFSERERQAIHNSIAVLSMLARNSLSPTQTKLATGSVGELLWLLGVAEIELDKRVYKAKPPDGKTINVEATLTISAPRPDPATRGEEG